MSYVATVCKLQNVRKHTNADRLNIASALQNQVIVGLDNVEGQIGVFFPPDGRLSDEMLAANDLVARKTETGERAGGFFDANGRVRAQKFRQVKSDGYWTPLDSLKWTGYDLASMEEGFSFDALNQKKICEKYLTPATRRAMAGGQRMKRGETLYFRKHVDTPQFRHVGHMIPAGSILYITLKTHGTSHRIGYVLDRIELPRWKQWINRVVSIFPHKEFTLLNGSRNVILEERIGGEEYDFRQKAFGDVVLNRGELIYAEICGYANETTLIMGAQAIKDKELMKQYGSHMAYRYGTKPGEQQVFVYRIAHVNEDGHVIELPWVQVIARCRELAIDPVPLLTPPFIYDGNLSALQSTIENLVEGPDPSDPSHIREGVVIRAESPQGTLWAKHKSWTFLHLEGVAKDNPDFVDTEEVA